jgi:hypothetical protein
METYNHWLQIIKGEQQGAGLSGLGVRLFNLWVMLDADSRVIAAQIPLLQVNTR